MTEELKIKLSVDTSSVQSTINKLKNEASNVNKALSGTSVSGTSKSSEAAAASSKKLEEAMGKVEQAVGKIKQGISGWDLAKAVVGAQALEKIFEKIEGKNSKLGTALGNSLADNVRDAMNGIQKFGPNNSFTLVGPEDMERLNELTKLEDKLRNLANEGDLKGVKNLKKEMKALGVSTKTAGTATLTFKTALASLGAAAATAVAAIGAVIAAISALVIAAGVAASFSVSKLGSEIYHTAQQFGFSSKAFQEWSYVMQSTGSSVEDLKGFLETIGSEQAAVIEGSEDAIATFKRLGLSASEVAGMDQQQLFEQTVAKIQAIGSATERSAIAYSLFGDEASRLMNVLNMNNAEMQEMINNYNLLGGGMSDRLIEQSNGLQSSISNLKQAWQGISNTLAEAFIPVVRAVVDWLTKALVFVNLFLRVIFGLDLNTKKSSSSMDKAVSSNKAYANSATAATKAVEKLKRTTMGFDELNIVQDPNKDAGGSGGGAGAATPGAGAGLGNMEDLMPDMSKLNLESLYAWFEEYKGVIAQITTWSLILIGAIMAAIGIASMNIPMAVAGIGLAGLGIAIGFSSGAFAAAWDKLYKAIKAIWDKIAPTFQPIIDFFKGAWKDIGEMGKEAWEFIEEVWSAVKPYFEAVFKAAVEVVKQRFYDLQMTLEIIWGVIVEAVKFAVEAIAAAFKLCWTAIKAVWDVVGAYFRAIWETIKGVFSVVKDVLTGNWKGAWEGIKGIVGTWVNYFKTIWNSIKSVFSGIGTFFSDIFKGAFNGVMGIVEKALNAIIKRMNKLSWDVPDWVPGIGGSKFGFNFKEVSIPRLATGGIVTHETLATIGEGGKREAVLPLEQNTGWMDALADKIAERNGGTPSKIVLNVDGKELGWATINNINNITRQTGGIQLALV